MKNLIQRITEGVLCTALLGGVAACAPESGYKLIDRGEPIPARLREEAGGRDVAIQYEDDEAQVRVGDTDVGVSWGDGINIRFEHTGSNTDDPILRESEAESIIANYLLEERLPFYLNPEIEVYGGDVNGQRFRPDFLVGDNLLIEYSGRAHGPGYQDGEIYRHWMNDIGPVIRLAPGTRNQIESDMEAIIDNLEGHSVREPDNNPLYALVKE